MRKTNWKTFIPYLIVAIVFSGVGFTAKAATDGSLPTYVGCKL